MKLNFIFAVVLSFALPIAQGSLRAADEGKDKSRLPSDHEAAALGFVAVNHLELIEVLNRLKASNHAEYEKAVKQIQQTNERLTKLSKEDTERYEAELRLWKVDSRLQLLAARMSVNGTSSANDELKQIVREEFEAKADLLTLEHKRQTLQLKKTEAEIARLNQARDKEIEARVNELKKEIGRMKHKSKPPASASSSTPSADSKSKTTP